MTSIGLARYATPKGWEARWHQNCSYLQYDMASIGLARYVTPKGWEARWHQYCIAFYDTDSIGLAA